MQLQYAESVLNSLWIMYGSSIKKEMGNFEINNDALIKEFFFVLLGGYGISFEQNESAFDLLEQKGYFSPKLYKDKFMLPILENQIKNELSTPQFGPHTKEGGLRKYRFINNKPQVLVSAGHWLYSECEWDIESKIRNAAGTSVREWLCHCPGFGMKTASWFIRNVGISYDCAVFDVHLLRFLDHIGINVPKNLNRASYISLEQIFRSLCQRIGATVGAMDYLLWTLGRNGFLAYLR